MSKRFYWKKIRPILISVLLCSIFFLIVIAVTSNRQGNLTIFVDRSSLRKCLSLSESKTLSDPKGKMYGPSIMEAWDTTEDYVPTITDLIDGDSSGDNYIAYTFYVFNSGIENLDYSMSLNVENKSNDLDEAIRVKLYVIDEDSNSLLNATYAKKNSLTNEPESGTVAFENDKVIVSHTVTDFEPDEVTKYSLVIWIEGADVDCTNDKIGGSISLSMSFDVLGVL